MDFSPTRACINVGATALITGLLAFAAPWSTEAQTDKPYPSKTVTLVVPFTAGSGVDTISRLIAPKLTAKWGQPVVVQNKPGASGNIGADQVAKADPDGYTLLMAINTMTMAPSIYKKLSFDPVADFVPITQLAVANFVFAVHPGVPAKDMAGLIAYAKANGGKTTYCTPGNGTPHHLAMELLKSDQGIDVLHVPYKGISGALTDLVGGQVQMMFATVHSMRPYSESGKVKLLAVTGPQRSPLAPDVPTFKEQGIEVMDSVDAWFGLLAPKGTPAPMIETLNRDFIAAMNEADVKEKLGQIGLAVRTGTPAEFSALIKSDIARWQKVVKDAGITAD